MASDDATLPGFAEARPKKPHYLGHRERLRKKFRERGESALEDYEILELLLFRFLPRRDTKPIAKALLDRFGSCAEVLAAPRRLLLEIEGLGKSAVDDLKLIEAVNQRSSRSQFNPRKILSSWDAVLRYCRDTMAFAEREEFRILFLDKKNGLIADEVQQRGTVDHTPVYPREIVKRALELSACAIILVHNHPSGDPTPSRADIQMTKQIAEIGRSLGIELHDHIIVARSGHASFRGLNLLS